ncbi:HAD hydrolase-like protein [Halosquirtibacter xylanolyticus]|uniref:HAD family hydrolase n=1 Tax=Halosquirtibacter xylanolyticus TaxID=3374599 RepID=UPI003748AB42|nr:HAD hydrolase-like protein [Prolixibacteraceae bacterium]
MEHAEVENVKFLIERNGHESEGIEDLLMHLKSRGLKIGLATNSLYELIPIILKKIYISDYFDFCTSAEYEQEGKPNLAVYLTVATQFNVDPSICVVFEYSYS